MQWWCLGNAGQLNDNGGSHLLIVMFGFGRDLCSWMAELGGKPTFIRGAMTPEISLLSRYQEIYARK